MTEAEARALESRGVSGSAVHRAAAVAIEALPLPAAPVLLDLGCGQGLLHRAVGGRFRRYLGIDIVRHSDWPAEVPFAQADLSGGEIPVPAASADVVAALGLAEYVENPRRLLRGISRTLRPGGFLVLSTPNHRSLRSVAFLLRRGQFAALAVGDRPMVTALLKTDLRRAAADAGLADSHFRYVEADRLPLLPLRWPAHRWFDRPAFRNTLLMVARRPPATPQEEGP